MNIYRYGWAYLFGGYGAGAAVTGHEALAVLCGCIAAYVAVHKS